MEIPKPGPHLGRLPVTKPNTNLKKPTREVAAETSAAKPRTSNFVNRPLQNNEDLKGLKNKMNEGEKDER